MNQTKRNAIIEIMREALRRETEAFNYYHKASVKAPFQDTRSLLIQLAEEERKHRIFVTNEIKRIEALYTNDDEESPIADDHVSYVFPENIIFKRIQSCKNIDIAAVSMPTELLGGDYLDSLRLPREDGNAALGLFLYDVMGHGMKATNLKALAKKEFGELRESWSQNKGNVDMNEPRQVITHLNKVLSKYCLNCGRFLSVFYGIIDPRRGTLTYTSAGHEPPVMITQKGHYTHLNTTELLLGVDEDLVYSEVTTTIANEEVLAFYSDGLTEAENNKGEMFDRRRLKSVISHNHKRSASDIILSVCDEVRKFIQNTPLTDELTLAVSKIEF